MSTLKPITLYSMAFGTNGWKINLILEELNLPFTTTWIPMSSMKSPLFTSINPNGRIPAIHDPNTNITLWESGAIMSYLVSTYDTTRKISFAPDTPQRWHCEQWIDFQISGQGPYWGQFIWFQLYHPEKVESARLRYLNEVKRTIGVLNDWLEREGSQGWLVGDKCTYADLIFIPWALKAAEVDDAGELEVEKYKAYAAWLERMKERSAVKKVLEDRAREMSTQGFV